jgi:hypothetical protein
MLDQQQARADYAARGEAPPMLPTAGRLIVKSRTREA